MIPDVTVRVRPAPAVRRYEAWIAESFEAGCGDRPRAGPGRRALPDVIRVSDEEETRGLAGALGPARHVAAACSTRYLGLRRRRGGCLVIVGFEGEEESVARRRALAVRELRAGGAAYLGQAAGRSWEHGRYQGPYLRDTLMELGAMVETLETSHTWTRLGELHARGRRARSATRSPGRGRPASSSATSPTPTPTAPRSTSPSSPAPAPASRDRAVAAGQAGRLRGDRRRRGTITHHHAVGRDHAPYMEAEVGRPGLDVLRAVKERLDPAGIMNPGKLLP